MSSFFDDLEAQLAGAARAQTAVQDASGRGRGRDRGRRARGRRWGAAAARVVPVGLTVLTAVAIAVLALTLLHHVRLETHRTVRRVRRREATARSSCCQAIRTGPSGRRSPTSTARRTTRRDRTRSATATGRWLVWQSRPTTKPQPGGSEHRYAGDPRRAAAPRRRVGQAPAAPDRLPTSSAGVPRWHGPPGQGRLHPLRPQGPPSLWRQLLRRSGWRRQPARPGPGALLG